MSRWFRHYAGMMRDEKLVRVAVRAKQPVERVVWVWGAILESAAEINDAGRFEFDAGEASYFLRCDEDELVRIVGGLEDSGRVCGGVVARWSDRQFDSDSAKERQRRYRERRKAADNVLERDDDAGETSPTVTRDVTVTSRDGAVTLQETETETDRKQEPTGSCKSAGKPSDLDEFKAELSTDVDAERVAAIVKHRRTKRGQLTGLAARLFKSDASACGMSVADAIDACISRNWITVKPEYFAGRQRATAPPPPRETVGSLSRRQLFEGKTIDATDPNAGRLDAGDRGRLAESAGNTRPFTLPANVLGRV